MMEKIAPTRGDKNEAAKRLACLLETDADPNGAADIMRKVLEEYVPGIEKAYARRLDTVSTLLSNSDLPKFVVDMMGTDLFASTSGKILRNELLERTRKNKPRTLLDMERQDEHNPVDLDCDRILDRLVKQRWKPGGRFAERFVEALGFPQIFAGISSEPPPDRVEEVYPRTPPPPLECFQTNMKAQILEMLRDGTGRAIVSLPTGAGKTRTVAEAIVEFWRNAVKSGSGPRFVVWISQTDELGEQAVACFRQLWEACGADGHRLNIFRVWSGRGIPYSEESGIVVAGIDQLYSIASTNGEGTSGLEDLGKHTGVVFIDEAHRSWALKYLKVLKQLGIGSHAGPEDRIPLIGLTATPERTARGETVKLRQLYGGKTIHPSMKYHPPKDRRGSKFDGKWSSLDYMKRRLTELGFLARVQYHWEDPVEDFVMSPKETEEFNQTYSLNKLSKRMGISVERNNATYRILKKWIKDNKRQVLFFGANVSQALLMSRFLEDDGIESATITSSTRYGTRKAYVRMFREGEIRALCNYNVLTTGFDAPKTDTVFIARPTRSRIVYQQMVGRGLRGPKFGGTETCDIITLEDDIKTDMLEPVKLGYAEYRGQGV